MFIGALIKALRDRFQHYRQLSKFAWKTGELGTLPSAAVMLVCGDEDRGYVHAGKHFAQILDSLNERLVQRGLETVTLATPYSGITGDQAFGNVFAVNGVFARATILQTLMRPRGLDRNYLVKAWSRVLNKAQPKIIIGIQPTVELCVAARSRGLWIADLQHGLLSDEGYYSQVGRRHISQAGWFDCLLCWDESSANWIRRQAGNFTKARVIGNPWFLRFSEAPESDSLLRTVNDSSTRQKKRPIILVSLQWGLERLPDHHETGMPIALRAFMLEHGGAYDWWLRVHPMLMQKRAGVDTFSRLEHAFMGQENVSWRACSEAPLPLVLRHVDLHVTSHSTVTVEASWFGIRSALLDNRHHLLADWFREQIQNGSADIVPAEAGAIRHWVENNAESRGNLGAPGRVNVAPLDGFLDEMSNCLKGVAHESCASFAANRAG